MKKTTKRVLSFLLLLPVLAIVVFFAYGYADSKNFWKVTDPSDSRFKVEKFDFNDYKNHEQMAHVLRTIFHVGNSKEKVDGVLVQTGGAITKEIKNEYDTPGASIEKKINWQSLRKRSKKIYAYYHKGRDFLGLFSWVVVVMYDDQDNVIQIFTGNEVVF